jgi:hypothetical protein
MRDFLEKQCGLGADRRISRFEYRISLDTIDADIDLGSGA